MLYTSVRSRHPMPKVSIEKFVSGGQSIARLDNQVIFVWNALPGEEVEIEYIKKKKDYAEAVATKILTPSPERVTPQEPCFLTTCPWDMLDIDREQYWKKAIARETYGKIGGIILQDQELPIVSDKDNTYGYRNKIEFSFVELPDGKISLAFFERGKKVKTPVPGTILAQPIINETASNILDWINTVHIPIRSLKSLIIRSSENRTIAGLFIKDQLTFSTYPKLHKALSGFQLYYSTHKSPASVPTKLLYSDGQDSLTADILGTTLEYGLFSFFQVNPPIFIKALQDIAAFLDPNIPIVDFYSGVGAISLPLSRARKETLLVDNNEEAISFAQKNIIRNNLTNCNATALPAEKLTESISVEKMVIVDPPRAGLHPAMVQTLLRRSPTRLIYLSCDLATQARDLRLLSERYKIIFLQLYNFFPRTPHIEGLAVLDRI